MNYFPIFQTATQLAYDDWCNKINLLSIKNNLIVGEQF
jgi:hypothetical protein